MPSTTFSIKEPPQKEPRNRRAVPGFLAKFFWRVCDALYPTCYRMGIRTMRVGLRFRWMARRFWRPIRAWGEGLYQKYWLPSRQRSRAERDEFRHDRKRAHRWIRYTWQRNRLLAVWRAICLPFQMLHRHRRLLLGSFDLLLPIAGAVLLALVIRYWNNATFALRLTYHGQYVGHIADEAVFDNAAALAEGRVLNADKSFSVDRTPELTLTLVQRNDLLDENRLCDIILGSYGNEVAKLSGIYVDGTFVGSTDSTKKVNVLLQSILDNYTDTHEQTFMHDVTTSFVQDVELVDGLYPTSTKLNLTQVKSLLTDRHASEEYYTVQKGDTLTAIAQAHGLSRKQLLQLNPTVSADEIKAGTRLLVKPSASYLDVQMVCEEVQEIPIPFKEETVADTARYVGDNYVKIPGVEGINQVTYAVTYMDGKEVSRTKLSEQKVQEPVTQINAVGARQVDDSPSTPGDGKATGRFVWPLPSSYSVGETYGYQEGRFHNGIDIYGDYGAPILASDGGTVVEAYTSGYNGGWGLNVLIDHGNGYMTRYAHCSSVAVTVGEKVSKGQMLGRVGSTGYSTCNHLHFEVYVSGSRVDPYPFIAG
ncbi:MAG: M23 family metallopeptidase [Clostridia bacterium]|nr:M23 family metallopeptidase [Clostridia bacterium]